MSNKAKTIIRMKRKREDDALDAFLISSNTKRQLTDSTVFSLAESVNVAEFSTITPRRGMKPNLSKSVESKRVVLSSKKIEEARNARYKIVESNRNFTIGNETFTLIDVTRHRAGEESIDSIANMVHGMDVDESKYVYDLYFHDAELPAHEVLDQRVGTFDLEFEDMNSSDQSSQDDDSEDSNAENYYANDYPDEEPTDDEIVYNRYDTDEEEYKEDVDYDHYET